MKILYSKKTNPILVIATTNRRGSLSEIIANYYMEILEKEGVPAELLSLSRLAPDFTEKALYANMGQDKSFNELSKVIEGSSKMVFIVPQYNGSFPGILKTFIDGLKVGSRDQGEVFKNKKCVLVGVSKGYQGNILGLSHLSDILSYLGMHVHPTKLYLSSIQNPSKEAFEAHPAYLERLKEQAKSFIKS